MDADFLEARITATKNNIIELETALSDLASGRILTYTIDTGQTRQTVTKLEISSLKNVIEAQYNLLATLEARLNGAAFQAVPGF